MFADIFPAEMLDQAILADMNFMGVDSKGTIIRQPSAYPKVPYTIW